MANEVYRCALCVARQAVAKVENDVVVADACLEAMCVHARAVLESLLKEGKQASDIHRTDFPGTDWPLPGIAQAESWGKDMKIINKHLAHLPWDRLSNAEEPWPETGFAAAVVELATAWTDHLALSDEALAYVARPWLLYSARRLSAQFQAGTARSADSSWSCCS